MSHKSADCGIGHCARNAVFSVCRKKAAISEGIVKEPILGSLRVAKASNQNVLIGFPWILCPHLWSQPHLNTGRFWAEHPLACWQELQSCFMLIAFNCAGPLVIRVWDLSSEDANAFFPWWFPVIYQRFPWNFPSEFSIKYLAAERFCRWTDLALQRFKCIHSNDSNWSKMSQHHNHRLSMYIVGNKLVYPVRRQLKCNQDRTW